MRDVAREWAQTADLPRRERLDSLDRFETFFRNVGGLAEPSAPLGVRRADGAGAAPSIAMPFGRFIRTAPPAQTWDGNRLDFGTPTEDSGWSAHSPATGTTKRINVPEEDAYWDLAMFVPVTHTTHRVADFALKVDGQTIKTWTDVLVSGNGLWLHRQLGVQELNSAITLEHIGGDPIGIAADGEASMQLVDRQVGEVNEPGGDPPDEPAGTRQATGSDLSNSVDVTVATPTQTQEGDILVALAASSSRTLSTDGQTVDVPAGWNVLIGPQEAGWQDFGNDYIDAALAVVWKVADAADVAGGESYTFTGRIVDPSAATNIWASAQIAAYRPGPFAGFGTPVLLSESSPAGTETTLNLTAPSGGGWILVVAGGTRARQTTTSSDTMTVEPPAVVLASYNTASRIPDLAQGKAGPGDGLSVWFAAGMNRHWLAAIEVG